MNLLKSKFLDRLLAALLTAVMVFGMLPLSALPALAAPDDLPGHGVLAYVVDGNGAALSGASVIYRVFSEEDDGTEVSTVTDSTGCVELLAKDLYTDGLKLDARVSMTDRVYDSSCGDLSGAGISANDAVFNFMLRITELEGVSFTLASDLVYNGSSQTLLTVSAQEGDVISYTVDGSAATAPEAVDAGSHTVTVTVAREGSEPLVKSFTVGISPATLELSLKALDNLVFSGSPMDLVSLTGSLESHDKLEWKVNEAEVTVASGSVPQGTAVGNYQVELKVTRCREDESADPNYEVFEASVSAEIEEKQLDLGALSIKTKELSYTGEEQEALTIENQGDYDLQYRFSDEDTWVTISGTQFPKVKDAGDYSIQVRAQKDGAVKDCPGSPFAVTVKKAVLEFELSANTLNYTGAPQDLVTLSGELGAHDKVEWKVNDVEVTVASGSVPQGTDMGSYRVALKVTRCRDDETPDPNYDVFETSTTVSIGMPLVDWSGITLEFFNTTVTYDGNPHYLVKNIQTPPGVSLKYRMSYDSENSWKPLKKTAPYFRKAGTFEIYIRAEQGGCEPTPYPTYPVVFTVEKAELGVKITAKEGLAYNEKLQDLVTLEGSENLRETDQLTWYLDGTEIDVASGKVPQAKEVGSYKVRLVVVRYRDDGEVNSNFAEYDSGEIEVEISNAPVTLGELQISGKALVYNGGEQAALDVQRPADSTYELWYRLEGETEWTVLNDESYPTVKDPGSYKYEIKATQEGYTDALYPNEVETTVEKAPQTLEFTAGPEEITLNGENVTAQYTAEGENLSEKDVVYELVDCSSDDVASIDASTGLLQAKKPGVVTVKASREGNEYYEDVVAYRTVTVMMPADGLLYFEHSDVDYRLNNASDDVADQAAQKKYPDDNGEISYRIDLEDAGLSIDETSGKITITDRAALTQKLGTDGQLIATVTATKTAGTIQETIWTMLFDFFLGWYFDTSLEDVVVYPEAEASYTVTIGYTAVEDFDAVWTISDPDPDTGWYNLAHDAVISEAKSKPQENPEDPENPIVKSYTVALDPAGPFADSVTDERQGTEGHFLYLQDSEGKVSAGIDLHILVDTVAPAAEDMSISYSEPYFREAVLATLTLGFYSESVDVSFRAADETSGLADLEWTYARAADASEANLASETGSLPFDTEGKAVLTISGDTARQYRGNLSFTARDVAGNVSNVKTDDEYVIIVDTISPECTVSYAGLVRTVAANGKEVRYFAGDIAVTVEITENNFYAEDFHLQYTKNGGAVQDLSPVWKTVDGKDNQHVGTAKLSGDGHYVVRMAYTDKSSHGANFHEGGTLSANSYSSPELVIDTKSPELSLSFDADKQSLAVRFVEHNFLPADIKASVTLKDIRGKALEAKDLSAELRNAKWTHSGDSYSYTTANLNDGIYSVTVSYKDPAGHSVSKTINFTVDHQAPTIPEISYSTPITETVLSSLTMGFYNPQVTVTFTAYDTVSGVDHFTWSYQRQNGASSSNVASYEEASVKAKADGSDKAKFTASVTMPLKQAEQIRGSVAVSATDSYKHTSNKMTDSKHVLVVDTVSPQMTVTYSAADNTVGATRYYGAAQKGQVQVTMNVNEANFFPEDLKVTVKKQGAPDAAVTPQWKDLSTDAHVGQFTVSGDGHYVIQVEYTDRSGNKMASYSSDPITIDTVKPVIEVAYQNHNVANTLTDREGYARSYFNAEQTAVITVTEHNFNAADVKYSIVGKDVAGAERGIDGLISKSGWTSSGDTHRMTIRYTGNANYSFDVDYTDLAKNQAADYAPDHFTVDTTAPTVTSVNYSGSVMDTVLSNVTFGFYNSKVTVTITANDDVSGVHRFDYSCLSAAGVSEINAQLLDQAIDEGRITFSNGGRTATISFDVPREALGPNNQFNGTIRFDAVDRSNNRVDQNENRRLVVDNVSPSCTVSYNTPVNTIDGIAYYDGSITGRILVNEANFYAEDAAVRSAKDGGAPAALNTTWSDENVNSHRGDFTIAQDGDYTVLFSYRDKSGNAMADYSSGRMIVDTVIEAPAVSINGSPVNGDAGAYKDAVELSCSFQDQNFDKIEAQLIRQRFDEAEDVTAQFVSFELDEMGGSGSFQLPEEVENDGIYTLKLTMTDKAGHSAETTVRFIANRFGSVYSYSEYLCSLIKDGGQHVGSVDGKPAVAEDLVITEYNADQLEDGSLNILITCNGEPVEAQFDSKAGSSDKWNEYVYTIRKETFGEDGLYKIAISSNDKTGNPSSSIPENSYAPDGSQILDQIMFTVDTTAPEIRNIVNLENEIADIDAIVDGKLNVKYKIMDTGGLASVEVYLNDELVDRIVDFGDADGYDGSFDIGESNDVQKVRILVTDMAGNVTDTASERFNPGDLYEFHDQVTVSTNFFVRWYRNAPAFWGSVGGVGVAAAGGAFLLGKKKKKKEEQPSEAKAEKPEKKSK